VHFDESAYRQLRGQVYRLAYRHLRDHSASEDIVQESFVRLAQYRTESVRNTGGMLRRIASNLIIDSSRSRTRRAEVDLSQGNEAMADEPSQEMALLQRERMAQVAEVLAQMPPLRRQAFTMRRLHGMSAKDVAAALSISPAAVDQHVARAVLSLHNGLSVMNSDKAA
jgi:RNA polymerase sigma factor (sigma-70 family)